MVLLALPTLAAAQEKPHHEPAGAPQVLAPGYSELQFPAPAAGSYALPAMGKAADGQLIDSGGSPTTLHDLYAGKTVVLSFIYTSCPDVNGCPLATFVLSRVQRGLAADANLRERVRLVTVSFDPVNDTPQVLRSYAGSFKHEAVDWQFLTAESEQSLAPILDAYDQAVIRVKDADGKIRRHHVAHPARLPD